MTHGPRPTDMARLLAGVALTCCLLAGCGDDAVATGEPASRAWTGPLHVAAADATHPRAGAAGEVVDCATWGDGGSAGEGPYADGATADSPVDALAVARSEGLFGGAQTGLLVAKEEDDRVLYVLEVDGAVKQAVIVHDGPATEGAGGDGWYVESWAVCDYSELPRSFTDSIGLEIWSDGSGRAVPTTTIEAWHGPEHCDWQSMTFLTVRGTQFVRRPQADLAEHFAGPYEQHTSLPGDAVDTGFERDGDHLWLAADGQRAFVGSRSDVEAWPRVVEPLGCM